MKITNSFTAAFIKHL